MDNVLEDTLQRSEEIRHQSPPLPRLHTFPRVVRLCFAQAKVEGLEAQVQDLQQQLKVLEVQKVRETAELDTLSDYLQCYGAPATPKPSAGRPQHVEQLHPERFTEQVRCSRARCKPEVRSLQNQRGPPSLSLHKPQVYTLPCSTASYSTRVEATH